MSIVTTWGNSRGMRLPERLRVRVVTALSDAGATMFRMEVL
jgi:antitoxin component of MazEF toxin-antitoxin module